MNIPSFSRVLSAEICPKFYSRSQEMFSHVALNIRSNLIIPASVEQPKMSLKILFSESYPLLQILAVGPTTESELKKHNVPVYATLRRPDPQSLIDCLQKWSSHALHPPPPPTCRHSKCSWFICISCYVMSHWLKIVCDLFSLVNYFTCFHWFIWCDTFISIGGVFP